MRGAVDCTAGVIATPDPERRSVTDDAEETGAWLQEHDYDSAPVYDDGTPVGYVTVDAATESGTDTLVGDIRDRRRG